MLFLLTGRAEAAEVTLNGETISTQAEIRSNTAYIPLRQLLETMEGWSVSWNAPHHSAEAAGEQFTLSFPIGTPHMLVDGTPYPAPTAYLKDGATYVPLRVLAELLALEVTWQGHDRPLLLTHRKKTYSEENLYWLSRIISAESRGEPLLGQLAVGTVVLNRQQDPQFPDSIREIIFDSRHAIQFEPVENGTIYDPPTAKSVLAAKLCLAGSRVAGDSLYFYAPALSDGTWIRSSRPYLLTIGCHKFYL